MSEDISVADEATVETDLSVGETAPVEVADGIEVDPLPEDFDLAAWVEGLRPTRRAYPVGGIKIVLQAHSMEWVREQMPELADLSQVERTAELVARHVVQPAGMTRAMLLRIAETHPVEFEQLDIMAAELDTRPAHMISPRFLRVASD